MWRLLLLTLVFLAFTTAHAQSSDAPFYFAYSSEVIGPANLSRSQMGLSATAKVTSSQPLEGTSLDWKGTCVRPGLNLTTSVSAKGNVAIIHVVGNLHINSAAEDPVSEYESSSAIALDIMPKANFSSLDAEIHAFGDVDETCSLNPPSEGVPVGEVSCSAGVGARRSDFGSSVGSSLTNESKLSESLHKHIEFRKRIHEDLPWQRTDFTNGPLQLGTQLLEWHAQTKFQTGFNLVADAELSASVRRGSATSHLDVTFVVTFSANGQPLPPEPGAETITLTKATTTDAKSVTVDYTVSGSGENRPVQFQVFRSSQNDAEAPDATPIGGDSVPSAASGSHTIQGIDLKPDPKKPFIIVKATLGQSKSSAYFRKWRLATVTHGYAGYDPATDPLADPGADNWDPGAQGRTIAWVNEMSNTLKQYHYCDDSIPFLWVKNSVAENPGMTEKSGLDLARQIRAYITTRSSAHPGDVVDLLMIGHSRGTVVTCQALNSLQPSDVASSNVQVVLLDCHPASIHSNPPEHVTCDYSEGAAHASFIRHMTITDYLTYFQSKANDPEISFPPAHNITSIEIWWQKTEVKFIPLSYKEHALNLWGIGQNDRRVDNQTGIDIKWVDVTSHDQFKTVGHDEVHDTYLHYLINNHS